MLCKNLPKDLTDYRIATQFYTTPRDEEFFTKYVNQQEGKRDTIAGLRKEKRILNTLADTGVTPRVGDLKIYPNEKRARLIIEQIPGVSLDRMNEKQSEQFLKEEAELTVYSTANALHKVHQKGILLVDLNAHTIEDREAAFRWYSDKDIGLR